MIEIEIPKNIDDYEAQLLGPFTLRQCIALVELAVQSVVAYKIVNVFTDSGLKVMIPMFLAVIPFLFGFYKPYGMHFEEYFVDYLFTNLLPPKKRLYKVENLYEAFEQEIIREDKAAAEQTKNEKRLQERKNKREKRQKQ